MGWSTHGAFSEENSNCWRRVLLLPVLVSDLPSILATTLRHKSSHSSNLLCLHSPCCHDVPLARTYFQRLQRGSVCLGFDRRKAAGAESPRSSSCAVHLLPMWTQTQENWSVTRYACSVRLVDWLIAKPELGTWPWQQICTPLYRTHINNLTCWASDPDYKSRALLDSAV